MLITDVLWRVPADLLSYLSTLDHTLGVDIHSGDSWPMISDDEYEISNFKCTVQPLFLHLK